MRRPIENNSSPGPAYVDVAVLRWQAFTGHLAVLEADGTSYEATAAQRATEGASDAGAAP